MKTKNLCQLAVFFVGFFFINELLAFTVEMTDKSRQYLGMIFGGSVGPIVLSDEHNVVIGRLFAQLNTVIFVLGTLMVGYITVVSTLNTAKEGHAMGQKWSSLWIPVRSVLGLLVMVPTPVSGYSFIQVTVMFFVLQGVGAANSVWQVALDAIGSGLTVTAVKGYADVPDATSVNLTQVQTNRLQGVLQGTFQAAVCSKFLNRFVEINQSDNLQLTRYNTQNTGGGQVSMYLDNPQTGKIKIGFQGGNPSVGGDDFTQICGRATIQCQNLVFGAGNCLDPAKINNIYQGLSGIYQSMLNLVDPFFNEIDGLRKPFDFQAAADDIVNNLRSDSGLYEQQIAQMKSTILQMARSSDKSIAGVLAGAKRLGWIHAGSYYMMLNKVATAQISNGDYNFIGTTADPTFGMVPTSVGTDIIGYMAYKGINSTDVNSILSRVRAGGGNLSLPINSGLNYASPLYSMMNLSSAPGVPKVSGTTLSTFFNNLLIGDASLVPHAQSQEVGRSAINGGEDLGKVEEKYRAGGSATVTGGSAVRSFQKVISQANDPLLGISMFGAGLMITAETMVVVAFAASVALSLANFISCPVNFSVATNTLIGGIMFPAVSAAILLWSTGATFAVYMPMIPYLMFTVTAVGWMFAVIEAVVAAPVLALGFVSPSGDELGKAGQGMLILVGLFLKPTLMILGFILASRLLKAILTMVNNMFVATLDASIAGVSLILGWAVPMVLYAGLVISLTNKCFSLIHILPEKVLRWIGAQGEGFAVEEVVQKAESKASEGIGAGQSVLKGAGESAQKSASDKLAADAKRKADNENG